MVIFANNIIQQDSSYQSPNRRQDKSQQRLRFKLDPTSQEDKQHQNEQNQFAISQSNMQFRSTANTFKNEQNFQTPGGYQNIRNFQSNLSYKSGPDKINEEPENFTMSKLQDSPSKINFNQNIQNSGFQQQQQFKQFNQYDNRDRVIIMYQDEINQHKQKSRNPQELYGAIDDLQRKIQMISQQITEQRIQNEQQLQQQAKQINCFLADNEGLKRQVHEQQMENIQLIQQIDSLKRQSDTLNNEFALQQKDGELSKSYNQQVDQEIGCLNQDLRQQSDIQGRQKQQLQNQVMQFRQNEKEIDDMHMKSSQMEKENDQLTERIHYLNQMLDQKQNNIYQIQNQLDQKVDTNQQRIQEANYLEYQIQDKANLNQKLQEEQKRLLRKNESEYSRQLEMKQINQDNYKRINELETQIHIYQKDLEGVRYSNGSIIERNDELSQELACLGKHAELLVHQNQDLQIELDNFVATDDVVKRNLDRKNKVQQIRMRVDDVIQKSFMELASKSPQKGQKSNYQSSQNQGRAQFVNQKFDQSNSSPLRVHVK